MYRTSKLIQDVDLISRTAVSVEKLYTIYAKITAYMDVGSLKNTLLVSVDPRTLVVPPGA